MPGPKPQGEHALTTAERQARYRAARKEGAPISSQKPRPTRWRAAVAELLSIQAEYRATRALLTPSQAVTRQAAQLVAICALDLTQLATIDPPP